MRGETRGGRQDHTFFVRRLVVRRPVRELLLEAWGDVWGHRGSFVVGLAVNHPHSDFLCCLWAQCPSATCGSPSSLCYSVGTLLCWWISMFCPWATKRTPAGLLQTTSRYRHNESNSVESKMTLSLLSFLPGGLHCCYHFTLLLVELPCRPFTVDLSCHLTRLLINVNL